MIEKLNISIEDKQTKEIRYHLNLDSGYWTKSEYDSRGNITYYENITGFWFKYEYDNYCEKIYYETSDGYIRDDRTN